MKREERISLVMSEHPPPYGSLHSSAPPSYPYLMSFEKPPTPPMFVPPPEPEKLFNVDFRDWLLIHSIFTTMLNVSIPVWFQFPRPIFYQYLIFQSAYTMILFNGVVWKRIKSLQIIRIIAVSSYHPLSGLVFSKFPALPQYHFFQICYLFLITLYALFYKWLIHYGIIQIHLPDHPFDNSYFFSSRTWWSICQIFHIVFPVALLLIGIFYLITSHH